MLKLIRLLKAWGEHEKGDTVEVDPERAARMIEEGSGMDEEEALLHGVPGAPAPAGIIYAGGKPKA